MNINSDFAINRHPLPSLRSWHMYEFKRKDTGENNFIGKRGFFLLLFACLLNPLVSFSQNVIKKPIDKNVIDNWTTLGESCISNDGRFVCYSIGTGLTTNLIVKKLNSNKEFLYQSANSFKFSDDSKLGLFNKNDTLILLNLYTGAMRFFPHASGELFQLCSDQIFVYHIDQDFFYENLSKKFCTAYHNVINYQLDKFKHTMILQKPNSFFIVDLVTGKNTEINKKNAGAFIIDNSGDKLIFTAGIDSTDKKRSLFYYNIKSGELKVLRESSNEEKILFDEISFDFNDDKVIIATVKNTPLLKKKDENVGVSVWSYNDIILQPEQMLMSRDDGARIKREIISLNDGSVSKIDSNIRYTDKIFQNNFNYILTTQTLRLPNQKQFTIGDGPKSLYLTSTKTGKVINIISKQYVQDISISPDEKYVVYSYDSNYFSFDIIKQKTNQLTNKIDFSIISDRPSPPVLAGSAGWLSNNSGIVVYDKYDIWMLDPANKRKPINITAGFGRKNKIQLKLFLYSKQLAIGDRVILKGFDQTSKEQVLYTFKLGGDKSPEVLIKGNYVFSDLKESKNKQGYLLTIESATEAPNLYYTKDFQRITKLTEINPQKKVNWFTSELYKWAISGNKNGEGVLYKPAGFDTSQKYPVIIHIYEKFTNSLNVFKNPKLSNGDVDIPWFLSRGYLVFEPDIEYTVGKPEEDIAEYVLSAIKELSKNDWISRNKIGLAGISFGGYEVNCLVTKTNIFRAAAPSSAVCDLVSMYGSLRGSGEPNQWVFESHQGRLGATLYDRPGIYIKNSPIFDAAKITTPLLIMHNKNDKNVPWEQGIEWFTALRRLGKKAWILQYDGPESANGHGIYDERQQLDYTIRLQQFFDFYLKDSLAPTWMTQIIPIERKGLDEAFQLDSTRSTP